MAKRILGLTLAALLLFGVVEARLYVLASDPDDANEQSVQQSQDTFALSPGRGMILDYLFRPMTNCENSYVAVIPQGSRGYLSLFDYTVEADRPLLYSSVGSDAPFLVRLNGRTQQEAANVFAYARRYRAVPLAEHTIGYCDADGNGVTGMEKYFNDYLAGGSDEVAVECATNAYGATRKGSEPQLVTRQGSGNAIRLSLDTVLQRVAEDVAAECVQEGAIVVLESRSGRIKASVSMPQYDPYDVQKSIQAEDTALINRAVSSYNVGSVFKPFLAALALEEGFDPAALYDCSGSIDVEDQTYHCAHLAGHGSLDMAGALSNSCNCYFVWLGQQLGGSKIRDFCTLLGFGQATQLGGGYTGGKGNFPTTEELQSIGQLAQLSFGQGRLTATPVQMAAAFNVFANNGVYISPTLVESKVNSYTGEVTESFYCPQQIQAVSEETAARVREMLVGVVEDGLGSGAKLPEAAVGGKTGTAQTGRWRTLEDGTKEEVYESWFVGFYPADDPEYTIVIMMDTADTMGEDVAPVFSKLCRSIYYLEIQD